jgi:DegV family protein with EDD domain
MSEVAIVTDSISCIPPALTGKYNISVIPAGLVIDRKVYPDMSISNDKFWEMFYTAKEPITTNAISPQEFHDLFSEIGNRTDNIVCILFSKVFSSTFAAAESASKTLKEERPKLNIEIIDSKTATGAEGFVVLEAAKAAQAGKSLAEVVKVAHDSIPRANFFCSLDTLKYLIHSGRAPKIALLSDLMRVKPIISINKESGLVENVGRARGKEKALRKMVDMVRSSVADRPVHLNIHYSDNAEDGEKLKKIAASKLNAVEIFVTPYSPVMASQCGPVAAIAYYA